MQSEKAIEDIVDLFIETNNLQLVSGMKEESYNWFDMDILERSKIKDTVEFGGFLDGCQGNPNKFKAKGIPEPEQGLTLMMDRGVFDYLAKHGDDKEDENQAIYKDSLDHYKRQQYNIQYDLGQQYKTQDIRNRIEGSDQERNNVVHIAFGKKK